MPEQSTGSAFSPPRDGANLEDSRSRQKRDGAYQSPLDVHSQSSNARVRNLTARGIMAIIDAIVTPSALLRDGALRRLARQHGLSSAKGKAARPPRVRGVMPSVECKSAAASACIHRPLCQQEHGEGHNIAPQCTKSCKAGWRRSYTQ